MSPEPRIRVLIVDDSAFARKVIREVLEKDPAVELVGYARDGLDALEKIAELKPDVVTLDLIMPDLDGIGVLRALPKGSAPKVIVVSVSGKDSELGLEALEAGAIDLVTKPTALPTDRLYELSHDLIFKVKAAAAARTRIVARLPANGNRPSPAPSGTGRLLVIGTSTGGPQALTQLFRDLPAEFPLPIAIALHIPAGYTAPLAARISKVGAIRLEEAADGMELRAGVALIAPGGMHLRFRERGQRFFAVVAREPVDSIYHPSVDLLFESAAEVAGRGAVGVILTGMGNDGLRGAQAIRERGGKLIAESESSCVVFGMPRSVIEAGLADAQGPLEKMSDLIVDNI